LATVGAAHIVLDMGTDHPAAPGPSGPPPRRRSVFPGFADLTDRRPPVIRALVALRQAEGLSQADVARVMGTSQPAVARLESGSGDVRLTTLARYADALGHDLAFDLQTRSPRPERKES
jgi:DNA-binding XRE family transcriptional regulator